MKYGSHTALSARLFGAIPWLLSVLILGCLNPDPDTILPPKIAYESPATANSGVPVLWEVDSSGGPVTHYAVSPALPSGLTLDSVSGRISGSPNYPSAATDYSIIAKGPGGADTAEVTIQVVIQAPTVSYANDIYTFAVGASIDPVHKVEATGIITGYAIAPELPAGLVFSSITGTISGTPRVTGLPQQYVVTVTGPGGTGSDTVEIEVAVLGSGSSQTNAHLALNLGLEAAPQYPLSRMVVTLTPNNGSDAVLRDTVRPGDSVFEVSPIDNQYIIRHYSLKPLRSWTVRVKTLDTKDSVIHSDSMTVSNLLVGEWRTATMNLQRRYEEYAAEFLLPDSIQTQSAPIKSKVTFTRLAFLADGILLDDSAFTLIPGNSLYLYSKYVRRDADSVALEFYGNIPNAAPPYNAGSNLLYGVKIPTASVTGESRFAIPWRGPSNVSSLDAKVNRVYHVYVDGPPPVILIKQTAH